jgi:beta-lactamase regulating signal transducer with metallopeptidase domain
MPVQEAIVLTDNNLPAIHTTSIFAPIETINYFSYLLLAFYLLVSSILFYRFVRNLTKLLSNIRGYKTVIYSGAILVLTDNNTIPYSFLKYIFINRKKFEKGTIEKEVLQHELAHVKQMHSLDVLFVEFVIAFAWFNPLLFLFRRAILLNHEFLADDSVVKTFNDAKSYQLILF